MTKELKDRKYRLTVQNNTIQKVWDNLSEEGLKISGEYTKTGDSAPNTLKLSIYNLSKEDRKFVGQKGNLITLELGYKDDFGTIFKGTIDVQPKEDKNGNDWVTEIECKDGIKNLRAAVLSKAFSPNTSQETVIGYVAKQLGCPTGTIKGLPKGTFEHGESLSGPAKNYLDSFCSTNKLNWSIQDGILHIYPNSQYTNNTAIVLDSESGLVGSPDENKVVSLLRPGLNPGTYIEVRSMKFKDFYIIQNVKGKFDTHGNDFTCELVTQKI